MLAITESTNPYMDQLFREVAERAERVARERDERDGPYWAEIGCCEAKWHLVAVHPCQEGVAAAHLSARRFGVYVPEIAMGPIVVRGRARRHRVKMFPGYVFVWCWEVARHQRRIEACPGVSRLVRIRGRDGFGAPIEVPDDLIGQIQVEEETSLIRHELRLDARRSQPKKRRNWRKKRLVGPNQDDVEPIKITTKSYWTTLDGVDDEGRVGALNQALSLP